MNDFDIQNIKLIIGLGNLGDEYEKTRHNAGFLFLDVLAKSEYREEKKFHAQISKLGDILLAKPTTMMNMSGITAFEIKKYYKFKPKEIMVVYDDLDIDLGEYKIQYSKYPKVHNGLNSVLKYLGSDKFWSLRIGVDSRSETQHKFIPGYEYVLKRLNQDEEKIINETFVKILETQFK